MSFLKEFKEFAKRGNAIDLAVGVILGATFGKIVSSLVNDIIMPPIGVLLGGVDFSDLSITIKDATDKVPAVVIKYGAFINTLIDFAIVALVIFLVVKVMNRLLPKPSEPIITEVCPECKMAVPLSAIRCGHCGVVIK